MSSNACLSHNTAISTTSSSATYIPIASETIQFALVPGADIISTTIPFPSDPSNIAYTVKVLGQTSGNAFSSYITFQGVANITGGVVTAPAPSPISINSTNPAQFQFTNASTVVAVNPLQISLTSFGLGGPTYTITGEIEVITF